MFFCSGGRGGRQAAFPTAPGAPSGRQSHGRLAGPAAPREGAVQRQVLRREVRRRSGREVQRHQPGAAGRRVLPHLEHGRPGSAGGLVEQNPGKIAVHVRYVAVWLLEAPKS